MVPATRIDMTDDRERQVAAEIEQSHPHWAVIWGCYSRRFWAFPYFQAPQGTIVSAPDRDRLLADMHSIELKVSIKRAERAQLIGPAGFLAHGLLLSADDPAAAGAGSRNIPPLNNDLRGIR
jgi:hypothetical protein